MTAISKIGRADDGSDQLQEITNHKQLVDFLVLLRNRNEAQDAAASSSSSSAVVNPGAGGNFPPISEAGLSVASAVASQAGKAEKPASGATGDSPGESVVSASGAAQALKPDKLATKVVGDPGKLSEPSGLVSAEAFGVPTSSSSVTASSDKNINGLLIGTKWTSGALTYSFPDSILDYETPYRDPHASSFTPLTAAQKAAARKWIANGGEYYNVASSLSFTELLAGNDQNADLRLASSDVPSTAFGYYPQNTVAAGDVWFNRNSYQNPILGTYDYHTFGHELGHALGLKHGHEQGGVANVAMDANRDSMEFSIMTYRSFEGQNLSTLGFYTNAYGHYAQSLMMYDIAAIQYLYGAWFGYNSGNTTYTFSPTTGQMFINGVGQGVPAANVVFRTIWDGAGLDTYDYSNYATNQSIDLRPGQWSSFDTASNAQRAILNNGYGGVTIRARGNVFNALLYQGNLSSLIENAIGGSGNDYLLGNQANNVLDGRGGNDTINALTGTDTTKGGDGNDVVLDTDFVDFDSHDGQTGIDTISYEQVSFASGVTINLSTGQTVVAGGNTETIVNFENVIGSGGGETIIGSAASNVIDGRGGNDTINALGGADTSRGGDGDDLVFDDDFVNFDFHDGQAGTDTISYEKVSFASGVTINLASGQTAVAGGNTETILNFENAIGSGGGETIIGSALKNVIDARDGADVVNPGAGADVCTLGVGNDIFVAQFGREVSGSLDRITDFVVGLDRIDLLSTAAGALARPSAFSRAADVSAATTIGSLMTAAFADCNGALAGSQALGLNAAVFVRSTNAAIAGSYIFVNDAVAGLQTATDIALNVTGINALPALGALSVATYFA